MEIRLESARGLICMPISKLGRGGGRGSKLGRAKTPCTARGVNFWTVGKTNHLTEKAIPSGPHVARPARNVDFHFFPTVKKLTPGI